MKLIMDNVDLNNTQTFGYDDLNRLLWAQATSYGRIDYIYDQIGNMTFNSRVGSYAYPQVPNEPRPHAVTTAGGNSYLYDANGNMTGGAGRTIRYDYENRPTSVTSGGGTTTFVYDGDGGRVRPWRFSTFRFLRGPMPCCPDS